MTEVPVGEVQVAQRQVGPVDEHRVEDATALGEVLDVLVAAVLAWGSGPRGLAGDTVVVALGDGAPNGELLLRRKRERWHPVRVRGDEGALSLVPPREQLR